MSETKRGFISKDDRSIPCVVDINAGGRRIKGFSQESLKIAYAVHNLKKADKEALKVIIRSMVTGNELREPRRGKAIVESRP